jgi:hypothetical protein
VYATISKSRQCIPHDHQDIGCCHQLLQRRARGWALFFLLMHLWFDTKKDSTGATAAEKPMGERERSLKPARHNPVGRSALYYVSLTLIVAFRSKCQ